MTFTYTTTYTLDAMALPPVVGNQEQRAYWVAPTLLAWPLSLLPKGMNRESVVSGSGEPVAGTGLSLHLVTAPRGGAAAVHGRILGADSLPAPTITPLRVVGNLPQDVRAAHPHLEGYIALSATGDDGTPLLDVDAVKAALTGQVTIVQYTDTEAEGTGGNLDALTGVQTAIVLDHLYARSAAEAELGVVFHHVRDANGTTDGTTTNGAATGSTGT